MTAINNIESENNKNPGPYVLNWFKDQKHDMLV